MTTQNRCAKCGTPIPPALKYCGKCLVKRLDKKNGGKKNGGNNRKGGKKK